MERICKDCVNWSGIGVAENAGWCKKKDIAVLYNDKCDDDFKQRVTKETLQELEDVLAKLGIAAKDENGNYRLGGDVLNDIKEKIRKDFGT